MAGNNHQDERYEHYILCVMSTIFTPGGRPRTMSEVEAATKSYEHDDNGESLSFKGFQTNEAPVKCLVDLGLIEEKPVTHIICLTSPACEENAAVVDDNDQILTAKDWFERSIVEFYRDYEELPDDENPALQKGFFRHLPYNGTNPSENLQALISVLDECPALIDIDTTGGPRDAAFLLTSVVQFIEAKYAGAGAIAGKAGRKVVLGRTVYSNLEERRLHLQNETFALNHLIRAITAFTQHGVAKPLSDYFVTRDTTGTDTSSEMKRLCDAMESFSDDLSLCRVSRINDDVDEVHRTLNSFEVSTGERSARFQELQAIKEKARRLDHEEDLDSLRESIRSVLASTRLGASASTTSSRMRGLGDLYHRFQNAELASLRTSEEIASYIDDKAQEFKVRRGEILFMSLVDNLRNGIPKPVPARRGSQEEAQQTLEIIEWCASRMMLQQALAVFREQIPTCLEQLGVLAWRGDLAREDPNGYGPRLLNVRRVQQMVDLAYANSPNSNFPLVHTLGLSLARDLDGKGDGFPSLRTNTKSGSGGQLHRTYEQAVCAAFPKTIAKESCMEVVDESRLRLALVYYHVINSIRNNVMHAQEGGDQYLASYIRDCGLLFEDLVFDYDSSPSSIRNLILMAANDIKTGATLCIKPPVADAYDTWMRDWSIRNREGCEPPTDRIANRENTREDPRPNAGIERRDQENGHPQKTYRMQATGAGLTPEAIVDDIKKRLFDEGYDLVELVGNDGWKETNVLITTDPSIYILYGLRIKQDLREQPRRADSMDQETLRLCNEARDTILTIGNKEQLVFIEDIRHEANPFKDSAAYSKLATIPPSSVSGIARKLALSYPCTFEAVRCVRRRMEASS